MRTDPNSWTYLAPRRGSPQGVTKLSIIARRSVTNRSARRSPVHDPTIDCALPNFVGQHCVRERPSSDGVHRILQRTALTFDFWAPSTLWNSETERPL
jgi:hypothetical protein